MAVNRDHDVRAPSGGHGQPGSAGSTGSPTADPASAIGADARGTGADGDDAAFAAGTAHGVMGPENDGRSARAQARREQRRSTLLAAATRVFKDKGYHAASVNDIIDAAQIARGTFYLYFNSKREVFAELSATFLALIRGSVRKISLDPADGEPLAQMRANFRRVMNTVLAHRDLAAIMLRGDPGDAEARAQLAVFYDGVVELIGQAVRVGHAVGIARDCDVQVIGVVALAGLKEVLGRMLDARDESADPAVDDPSDPALDPGAAVAGRSRLAADRSDEVGADDPTAPPARSPQQAAQGAGFAASPWRRSPEALADELLTFFVRGVFTQDAR